MRQVLIIALLALAVMAAKNCSSVSAPAPSANYFMPPFECVSNDTQVKGCMDAYSSCVRSATDGDCTEVNRCYLGRMVCLVSIVPTGAACEGWTTSLENAALYLTAGGTYKDSTLEAACEYGLCYGNKEAFTRHDKKAANGDVCAADFAAVCATAPSFEPPTRAPTQAEYTVTFGGAGWADVLANAPKESAKYKELEAAIGKGLSKVLGVPQWLIIITDISVGSLIVKFIVREDPTGQTAPIDPNTALTKLNALVNDADAVATSFAELQATSGITITVSGVTGDIPTPTPATATPTPGNATQAPSAAGLVSVAAAVVAVLAMIF